ncbi:MAG TPA: hypothetical protein VJR89_18115, partial [Polyangiales bacterium]|nr:hypothetical protein [Polyangiales bacterium]
MARRLGASVAAAASCAIVCLMLWLACRPLATPDLWFHLKAGETYLREGLWPRTDPMLFTGLPSGPVQHEWLFGVFAYLCREAVGFQGLRVVHGLCVLGTLWLVARIARKTTGEWAASAWIVAAFVVLSHQRLMQFRPDLWSIPATLLLYSGLVRERELSLRRVLGCALLFLVWNNAHSLATVALFLLAAAALGMALELAIRSGTIPDPAQRGIAKARLLWLCGALAVLCVVGLIHPRGAAQLFSFFSASADTAVWQIVDEWHAFDPLRPGPPHNSETLPLLSWALADLMFVAFAATVAARVLALKRELSSEELARFDPALFLLAVAACGAMLISIRFLWLGLFPLLYVAQAWPASVWRSPPAALSCGVATAALLALWPGPGRFSREAADTPAELGRYLATPINRERVADEGVQFLAEAQLAGRIFNPYEIGAYLGYRLAPRVRTFIDSRTEHYSAEVFEEWQAVTRGRALPDGRSYLRLLDDRAVDLFFALGPPGYGYQVPYTLALLERAPGWKLIYRNAGQAIYLRDVPRNQENLQRVVQYYQRVGVPFDAARGFAVGAVLAQR